MIVIDTSVIIAVASNEKHKDRLVSITLGQELIAPQSVRWEIGNAFSSLLKRKMISLNSALSAMEICLSIPIRYADLEPDECLKIASEFNICAYDAYILRCAIKYKSSLLTLDKSLLRIAKQKGIEVLEVLK